MNRTTEQRLTFLIPVVLLAFTLLLVSARGPFYWSDNFDPEYAYLLNSVNLLTFNAPHHIDHPGTTLQEFGAVVILARWLIDGLLRPWQSVAASALSHPEDYLHTINLVLQLLFCGMLWAAGRQVWRTTGSLAAAMVLQAGFMVYGVSFDALARVTPESLLMSATLGLAIVLFPVAMGDEEKAADWRRAMLAGAIVGFGVVTKLTFAPLAAMVLAFPGWRQRLRFVLAAAGSTALFLLPVWGHLSRIVSWIKGLAMHRERYGRGEVGLPSIDRIVASIRELYTVEPFLFYLTAAVVVALVVTVICGKRFDRDRAQALRRVLVAGLVSIGGLVLVTLKHYATHYALPAMALTPFLVAVIVARYRQTWGWRSWPSLLPAGMIVLVAMGVGDAAIGNYQWSTRLERTASATWAQERLIAERPECLVAGVYRSALPGFALYFGNFSSDWRQRFLLERLYPNEMHYQIYGGNFESYDYPSRNEEVRQRIADGGCVLIQGSPEGVSSLRGFRFEPLTFGRTQRVYELTGFADLRDDLAPSETAVTMEAESFVDETDVEIPDGGRRPLFIRYSSKDGWPVTVWLNGEIVTESACTGITGERQLWERVGVYEFQGGTNRLRLTRADHFPEIDKIVVGPPEEATP